VSFKLKAIILLVNVLGTRGIFVSEELTDKLAAPKTITKIRRQVRLSGGWCIEINAQLEVEIEFGNRRLRINILILPGVEFPHPEIRCGGHKIQTPGKNRDNGWLEEKLLVADVQKNSEEDDLDIFLKTEQYSQNIKYKAIKLKYYPQNPKIQGEIIAKVDELLKMAHLDYLISPYNSPIVVVKKKEGKRILFFRQINAKSIMDAYPMSRTNYILNQLREARFIRTMDLKDGYWQYLWQNHGLHSSRERAVPIVRNAGNVAFAGIVRPLNDLLCKCAKST